MRQTCETKAVPVNSVLCSNCSCTLLRVALIYRITSSQITDHCRGHSASRLFLVSYVYRSFSVVIVVYRYPVFIDDNNPDLMWRPPHFFNWIFMQLPTTSQLFWRTTNVGWYRLLLYRHTSICINNRQSVSKRRHLPGTKPADSQPLVGYQSLIPNDDRNHTQDHDDSICCDFT